MMKLTLLQKIRSYFYPLFVCREASALNPVLELYYYRGRWQLATADALYSDGVYYQPLITAYKALNKELPKLKRVLVLGTGLGSAVQILARKSYHPAFTLVELDEKILRWAIELMPAGINQHLEPICANAETFLDDHPTQYDLIIVDVFEGRFVPAFVLADAFLQKCKHHLTPDGHLVLNYMVSPAQTEQKAKAALEAAFGTVSVSGFNLNRVFIARA